MSCFRIGYRAIRLLRQGLFGLVVLVMSCSLISMGGLIWIGNSWAVLPDDDPATSFERLIIVKAMTGDVDCDDLDPDGDGQIPLRGGKLVRGNGDQDDNRPEPLRIVCRPGSIIEPKPFSVPAAAWWAHRVVSSYLDFGHLKVFPDAVLPVITENTNRYSIKAATLYTCGGLFCCYIQAV